MKAELPLAILKIVPVLLVCWGSMEDRQSKEETDNKEVGRKNFSCSHMECCLLEPPRSALVASNTFVLTFQNHSCHQYKNRSASANDVDLCTLETLRSSHFR